MIDILIDTKLIKIKEKKAKEELEKSIEFYLFGERYTLNLVKLINWEVYIFNCSSGDTESKEKFKCYEDALKYYTLCVGTTNSSVVWG